VVLALEHTKSGSKSQFSQAHRMVVKFSPFKSVTLCVWFAAHIPNVNEE